MNYLSAGSAGYSPPKMGNLRLPTRVASHWPSAGTPVNCRARNLASTIETLLDQKLLASAGFWGWQLMATQQFVEVETIQRIWDGKKKNNHHQFTGYHCTPRFIVIKVSKPLSATHHQLPHLGQRRPITVRRRCLAWHQHLSHQKREEYGVFLWTKRTMTPFLAKLFSLGNWNNPFPVVWISPLKRPQMCWLSEGTCMV
jgi:hypothetical protein